MSNGTSRAKARLKNDFVYNIFDGLSFDGGGIMFAGGVGTVATSCEDDDVDEVAAAVEAVDACDMLVAAEP